VKLLAVILALAATVSVHAQVFVSAGSGRFCASPSWTVAWNGNPSIRLAGGGNCVRPWISPWQPWGGFWPGNVWLGPVSFVSPNARRLPVNLGPAPTVPDPVAILPAGWVPQ
jgi:hypothetical protein